MRIVEARLLRGPNRFARRKVLCAVVDLEQLDEVPSSAIDGFTDRLLQMLPGIQAHHCGVGYEGGFVDRLREGTYMGHIAEHLMLELQSLAGDDVRYGNTRMLADRPRHYRIVAGYEVEAVALRALQIAIDLVQAAASGTVADVSAGVAELRHLRRRQGPHPDVLSLARAARERTIPALRPLDDPLALQLGWGARQQRLRGTLAGAGVSAWQAGDLGLARQWLALAGVPVPAWRTASTLAQAREAAQALGWPVAVRPRGRDGGAPGLAGDAAATPRVDTPQALVAAFEAAHRPGQEVLVERHHGGVLHRALVVGERVVALVREDPADGGWRPAASAASLVLPQPRREDRLAQAHPQTLRTCVAAAQRLQLAVAGIELVCEDIARPLPSQGGAVLAVDAMPGLAPFGAPVQDGPDAVALALVDHLFDDTDGRIPLVAVSGEAGRRAAVLRLVAQGLRAHGLRTAASRSDDAPGDEDHGHGHGEPRPARPMDLPRHPHHAVQALLTDPLLDAAVVPVAADEVLRHGLGFDRCDVAVMLGGDRPTAEAVGLDPPKAAHEVAAVVADAARRTVVLDAEDPCGPALADSVREGVAVLWLARTPDHPVVAAHRIAGGQAVVLRDNPLRLGVCEGERELPLPVPAALRDQDFGVVLATVAALVGLGLSPLSVGTALQSGAPHPAAQGEGP